MIKYQLTLVHDTDNTNGRNTIGIESILHLSSNLLRKGNVIKPIKFKLTNMRFF